MSVAAPTRSPALGGEIRPATQMRLIRSIRLETPLDVAAERQRIAQELQGRAIPRLFAIGLKLQAISSVREDAEISNRLHGCVNDLDVAISDLRAIIFNLGARNV